MSKHWNATAQDIERAGGVETRIKDSAGRGFRGMAFEGTFSLSGLPAASRTNPDWAYGSARSSAQTQEQLRKGQPSEAAYQRYSEIRGALATDIADLSMRAVSGARRRCYGDDGDEVDIDRFVTGDPACFTSRRPGAKRRLVRLGFEICNAAVVSEDAFVETVSAACAAVDLLEKLGYAVEVHCVASTSADDHEGADVLAVSAIVKHSFQPLDPGELLVCSLPGLLRDYVFSVWDVMTGSTGSEPWNQGACDRSRYIIPAYGLDAYLASSWRHAEDGTVVKDPVLHGFFEQTQELRSQRASARTVPTKGKRRRRKRRS